MIRELEIFGRTASEISANLHQAIRRGDFRQGEVLPTVRALALQLGVNRNTVAAAYKQLAGAGLLESRGRGGSVVAGARPIAQEREGGRNLAGGNPDPALLPDLRRLFADAAWQPRRYEDTPEEGGLIGCAEALFARDGLPSDSLWFANGAFDAVARILEVVTDRGDPVALEDPCFMTTLGLVRDRGRRPVSMRVDEDGVVPEALEAAIKAGAKVIVLTPRAQNPFGGSWTAERRAALAAIVERHPDITIIEDDHFADLSDAPMQSLVGAGPRRWAIIRSTSKSLGPDLRLAFVSSDASIRQDAASRSNFSHRWTSGILQAIAHAALLSPEVRKQIQRAGGLYRQRRTRLLGILRAAGITAYGKDGLSVWIPVRDEAFICRRLLESGWIVRPGSIFRLESGPGIRVTTSALSEEAAQAFSADLARALREVQVERGA